MFVHIPQIQMYNRKNIVLLLIHHNTTQLQVNNYKQLHDKLWDTNFEITNSAVG